MLYLVKGVVWKALYEQEGSIETEVLRLVEAEEKHLAVHKFNNHYTSMTSEYSVYYSTTDVEATEVIS